MQKEVGCIEVQEDVKEAFWGRRMNEQRIWCWIIMSTNLLFQTRNIIEPKSEIHWVMNMIYMVGSIVQVMLLLCSYKSQKRAYLLVLTTSVLVFFRQIIRLADIEQIKSNVYEGCENDDCTEEEIDDLQFWDSMV